MKNYTAPWTLCVLFMSASLVACKEVSREEKVAAAMRAIGDAWRQAIEQRYPLVIECDSPSNFSPTYAVRYLDRGAVLEYELRRTENLLEPYRGVVKIVSATSDNRLSSGANGYKLNVSSEWLCFNSPVEALDFSKDDSYQTPKGQEIFIDYIIIDNNIQIYRGNDAFLRTFKGILAEHNSKIWGGVLRQRIQ